jgi:hypothetical protein
MTQGLYELLGAVTSAPPGDLRRAYTRQVAQILRRRRALVEQGGDTAPLDVARSALDEAWEVLSDPVRRRRYDAMLALAEGGWTTDPDELWARASGALVHPAASAAADLLRVSTHLDLGVLPPAPRPRGAQVRREPDEEPTQVEPPPTRPRAPRVAAPVIAPVVPLPTAAPTPPASTLRVVEGRVDGAPVIMMPQDRRRTVSSEDIARLIDELGYTGAMLQRVREARGLSLQEIADTTRISVRNLEFLEADEYGRLPSATFVRGYVREVARVLSLPEDAVVQGYMRRFSGGS